MDSNVDLEQTSEGAFENSEPFLVGQARNGKDAVDRSAIPQGGIICSDDDLTGADYSDQMPHVLRREENGVVEDLRWCRTVAELITAQGGSAKGLGTSSEIGSLRERAL